MGRNVRHMVLLGAIAATSLAASAEPPRVYALVDARIVTASGPVIERGTVVIRDGLIAAVGSRVVAPTDAWRLDGRGLTVYPGLIDMGALGVVDAPVPPEPRNPATRAEVERWKRGVILRPQLEAADYLAVESLGLARFAAAGVTTVLAVPGGEVVRGRSALVNVVAPEEPPQIGALAGPGRGLVVLKTPVALHIAFTPRPRGDAYPVSLMGVIAFVRQSFVDAQHRRLVRQAFERAAGDTERPAHDPALDALEPAVSGALPVVFDARSAVEIRRALKIAAEFNLKTIIAGGFGADEVIEDLRAARVPVLYSLNFPTRPRTLAPEADEPLRVLKARAQAPRTPAALARAGIAFAFQSGGLRDPRDFVRHAARAVKEGLASEEAIRALTIGAARIAGVDGRLGSIEPGKIANLIVTEGDLFDETMKLRYVFIDGRPIPVERLGEERAPQREGRQ